MSDKCICATLPHRWDCPAINKRKSVNDEPPADLGELGEWWQLLTMDDCHSMHVYIRSTHYKGNPDYANSAIVRFVDTGGEYTLVGMTDDALETLGKMCLKFCESMRELQRMNDGLPNL